MIIYGIKHERVIAGWDHQYTVDESYATADASEAISELKRRRAKAIGESYYYLISWEINPNSGKIITEILIKV